MKTLFVATLCVAAVGLADAAKLNFAKINQVLGQTLEQVLDENDKELGKFFTHATVKIDEAGTDLTSKELLRVKGSARLTAKAPVWHPGGEATVDVTTAGDANLLEQSASVELKASIETQTQRLFTFVAEFLSPTFCEAKQPTPVEQEVCRELKGLMSSPTLTDVFSRLVNLQGIHTSYAAGELTRVQAELAAAPPDKKAYWEKREKEAQEEHSVSFFVQLAFRDALAKGKATGKFTVKLRDLNFFSTTELRDFEFYLSASQFDLGVKLTQTDIKDMTAYFKRRDHIAAELQKLQSEDPKAKQDARETISFLLQTLKSWIGGKPGV